MRFNNLCVSVYVCLGCAVVRENNEVGLNVGGRGGGLVRSGKDKWRWKRERGVGGGEERGEGDGVQCRRKGKSGEWEEGEGSSVGGRGSWVGEEEWGMGRERGGEKRGG